MLLLDYALRHAWLGSDVDLVIILVPRDI
eukprot:COSAG04_NODE_13651_length_597_cov_1.000000_1_plen_28_part_10